MLAAILAALSLVQSPGMAAVKQDGAQDPVHPAHLLPVAVPSGEVTMNAALYVAAGEGPHPTVLLLHGFPGNEQNLDLAQAMREQAGTCWPLTIAAPGDRRERSVGDGLAAIDHAYSDAVRRGSTQRAPSQNRPQLFRQAHRS